MKARLVALAERLGGVRIVRRLPFGSELHTDLGEVLPNMVINTIFDVGANKGQSARAFAVQFPSARIYSFEPIASTFKHLQAATEHIPRVTCVQLAFGAISEQRTIAVRELSPNNSLHNLSNGDLSQYPTATQVESVVVKRLDEFVAQKNVSHVDFLKIDTEGFDMEVLQGAGDLLSDGRIHLLQVEASMNPQNDKHVPFAHFVELLQPLGFDLLGLYEQTPEWSGEPRLRFCNAVFIHQRAAVRAP